MKIVKEQQLLEMSLERSKAIDRCIGLGKQFTDHFDKIYKDRNNKALKHWIAEMEAWLRDVNLITLKPSARHLTHSDKMDWFYTVGSSYETLFGDNEDEIIAYDKFVLTLETGSSVEEALTLLDI